MEVNNYYIFILTYFSTFFLSVICILYLKSSFKQEKAFKIFTAYLFVILTIQVCLIFDLVGRYNLHLSHFYFISRFLLLSLFYHTLFKKVKHKNMVKSVNIIVISLLTIQYIMDSAAFGSQMNTLEIVLTNLGIVAFSVMYFYNSLLKPSVFMYINSGILLYLLSSTLIFCVGNILVLGSKEFRSGPMLVNSVFYIVYLGFIYIEWFKSCKKTTTNRLS